MFRLTLSLLFLCCIGFSLCNHLSRAQLGSFEGTYSSEFGLGMYICQNGDNIHGYSDESFLFRGEIDELDVAKGEFILAGEGNCQSGSFELDLTSWGVEGFYICDNGKVVAISGVKQSPFRPTNNQCATLWVDDDLDLQGRYLDENSLTLDLCFRDPDDDGGDDDDETVQGSLRRLDSNGNVVDQFVTGFWYDNGKIFTGTWYEEFNAGAVLMYLRDNGNVDYTYWTGLLRQEGNTVIDGNQAYNHAFHRTGTWPGPRSTTTFNECTKFEVEQTFVLQNLRAIEDDDDDNYYYFVDTQYLDLSDIEYQRVSTTGSASTIAISFSCIVFAILAVIF